MCNFPITPPALVWITGLLSLARKAPSLPSRDATYPSPLESSAGPGCASTNFWIRDWVGPLRIFWPQHHQNWCTSCFVIVAPEGQNPCESMLCQFLGLLLRDTRKRLQVPKEEGKLVGRNGVRRWGVAGF